MRLLRIPLLAIVLLLSFENIHAQCIALTSLPGTNNQTVCINTPITNIEYTIVATVTKVNITGLPSGVTGNLNGLVFTISGTPTVSGAFVYTITTEGCVGIQSGSITVNAVSSIALTSGPLTPNQTVCINTAIANITYAVGGSSTGATVLGLPSGVNSNFAGGVLTISGSPNVSGTFPFTVTPVGPCVLTSLSGSIKVNPNASITLTSAAGTDNQTVCINNPIVNITYFVSGGGTGAGVSGLPTGVTGSFNNGTGVYTISGIPSVTGTFNYTITTTGTCVQATASGTITINANSTISAPTGSNNQTVCLNTPITNISYTIGGGATGATVTGLPTGVTGTLAGNVFTISGTPTVTGTFNYTVTTTGPCNQQSAFGTIKVNPNATITLTSAPGSNIQSVCLNSPITPITFSVTGGGTGAGVVGLPTGVTGVFNAGVFTISGSPTITGIYPFTVTTTGTCAQAIATGTITVSPAAILTLTSAPATKSQSVCVNTPITPITYSVSGGGTGATITGLPPGVTGVFLAGVVTISGTPTVAGIYNYTVTTTGTCTQASDGGTITVNAIPNATASNNGPVCVGSPLILTGGPTGMATYAWTGPSGFISNLQSPQVSATATLAMAGKYILTVTGLTGCKDTASTRVYVYVVPLANAGIGGTECDLNFILNAVPSVGIGLWTVAAGPGTAVFTPNANAPNATVTVSQYGAYTFRWTETNGPCISFAAIVVNFYQQPIANAGVGGDRCALDFTLSAVPSVGTGLWSMVSGPGTVTFTPDASTPNAVATVSGYGQYVFRWTESNGLLCTSNATVTVNYYQQPVANAGPGGNNCGLDYTFRAVPSIGTGTWTRVSGPGTAVFSPNANSPTAKVTVSAYGTYTFRWTEVNGSCSSSANINVVFIFAPPADAGQGGDECDKTFALNATLTSGTGLWTKLSGPGTATFSPNATQPNATVTVSQFGSYNFLWTVTNSTCQSTDAINVTFHDLPAVSSGPDLAVCKGSNIQLSATGNGTFAWTPANLLNNPNIANPLATPVVTTTFTVTLTDQYNCKKSDQVVVDVMLQPVADAGPDKVLDYVFETVMQAVPVSLPDSGYWKVIKGAGDFSNASDATSQVSNLSLGVNSFLWTVTNGVCPNDADTVNITVNNLVIPTLITPNQDGKNDFFVIRGIQTLGKCSLIVFDRWGARVYENDDYDNSWDGTDLKGKALPPDTYFFVLKPEKSKATNGYIVIRR